MNKIIDINGLSEEYYELTKELAELFKKRAEKRKMNQSEQDESRSILKEISMDGLSETEVDFIKSLAEVLRLRAKQEPVHIRTYPMGVISNISRADIYEEHLAHKFPQLPANRKSNK